MFWYVRHVAVVLLGPVVGPSRTGEPDHVGPAGWGFGRAWFRRLLDGTVLLGLVVQPSRTGEPEHVIFAGEVTPPYLLKRKAFANA